MYDRNSFFDNSSNGPAFDLATLDSDYDKSKAPESNRDPIPDGKYQVNVEKAELTRSKSTGNPMLKMTLKILAPSHVGRLLWHNNMFTTSDSLGWLKKDLLTCGMVLEKLSDLERRLHEIVDIKLEVYKKTNGEIENVYLNKRIYLNEGELAGSAPSGDVPF